MNRALVAILVVALVRAGLAQSDGFDADTLALSYHAVTGDALDTRAIATRSTAAMNATSFDRPKVIASEQARLDAAVAAMTATREFTLTVDDRITDYDHNSGQFAIELFTPGYFVPVQAFGQEYRIVFANAASARAIPMPADQARAFDTRLASVGRRVNNEIRFRVIGKGDPVGAVVGGKVVRAEIVSVRLLDPSGQVLFTPRVAAAGSGPPFAGFDTAKADVAGLRVGGRVSDMEATLTRLFGTVSRGTANSGSFKGFAGTLEVNNTGCFSMVGRRNNPRPGAVCVTAYFDAEQIVRMVRIERLFPPRWDDKVFRDALVRKYGPPSGSQRSGISWGPGVPGAVLNNPEIVVDALIASVRRDSDVLSTISGALENVIVSLQLIDAPWAATMAGGPTP
jgi:hypothetical protein